MAKVSPTILLNALQLATLDELRSKAVKGVVKNNIIIAYKMNVINALVRRGVLRQVSGDNYRILANTNVALKPDTKGGSKTEEAIAA
jgi:hypothetical protein